MGKYKLIVRQSVAKDLHKIPKADVQKILNKIQQLAINPRPLGCKKLSGDEKYRIRQGNYRILYSIDDIIVTVVIVKVAHRQEVYKN